MVSRAASRRASGWTSLRSLARSALVIAQEVELLQRRPYGGAGDPLDAGVLGDPAAHVGGDGVLEPPGVRR